MYNPSGSRTLRKLLAQGAVVAPTAYDMVAARIIEQSGFQGVFCSGYGQAASALGLPDDGSLTLAVLAERVHAMSAAVGIPVLVDADTGFDDPEQTVRELAECGASAVMIEDQVPAKRCGHLAGKQVVSVDEMLARISAAVDHRPRDLVLIARTDAAEPLGLEEALARGHQYANAGADIVFVEAPASVESLSAVAQELPGQAMANVIPGGRTPELSVEELTRLGFKLIVFGLLDLMLAGAALRDGFRQLAASGQLSSIRVPYMAFDELNRLTGLSDSVSRRQ